MPLFGRRLFQINENEHTNKDSQEKLQKIYELERWTCECSWKSGLTHKDACQSEQEIRQTLTTLVPEYFNKTVFEIIHHNVKPLEKVAEEISIVLGQSFVLNEPVHFKKRRDSTTVVKGTIERIEENDEPRKRISERTSVQTRPLSDKQMKNVKYAIRLADEDRVINNVLPNELQRSQLIPNREKLKTFIRSYAIRLGNRSDSPWAFYDETLKDKYQLVDRFDQSTIENARQTITITLDEIIREQDKLQRKLTDENNDESSPKKNLSNGHVDTDQITVSDDEIKEKKNESPKKKSKPTRSPTKPSKKQLTLHDMKFTKNSNSHEQLLKKSSTPTKNTTTYNAAVPYSLLQKLDKTRRDRGMDSRVFQRLILHCARTLNDKQRSRLPDEYRQLIQKKFDDLELKRRLADMTESEKKIFLQNKNQVKSLDDLDLPSSKSLPIPKQFSLANNQLEQSLGNLLMIYTFLTSCQNLFFFSLNNDLSKTTQDFLRTLKLKNFLEHFSIYFDDLLQILLKLLFKEQDQREDNTTTATTTTANDDEQVQENIDEQTVINEDFEQIYDVKLSEIPLTSFTCQELTRLYLSKEKLPINNELIDKLSTCERQDFLVPNQIDLLVCLINFITTNNEIMSEYFEYLTRNLNQYSRERQQLMTEKRQLHDEDIKQKKLQLQNGDKEKLSSKKKNFFQSKKSSNQTNDENDQSIEQLDNSSHNNDDDLKSVIQRRRQMLVVSKELKEKKDIELQKLHYEQKLELALEKIEQNYRDALDHFQNGFRMKPLGFDRYYNRYWFFKGYAGLLVEKGWIGSDIFYSVQTNSSPTKNLQGEKLIPKDEDNQWWIYDDEHLIEQFIQSLNQRGIREGNLLENMKKIQEKLKVEFNNDKSIVDGNDIDDQQTNDIIVAFKTDLEDIENRLRSGSLGGFIVPENLIDWQTKLKQTQQRTDLAELLIQLQQTVAEKFASGIFGTSVKTQKNASKKKKISSANPQNLPIWMNDCRTCQTFSRLYVLMMLFENSIAWSKSTTGLKCKICRKKNKEEFIVVCDQCCQGYHLDCLRDDFSSATNNNKNSLNDLWYCPACRPQSKSRRRSERQTKIENYDEDIYDMDVDVRSNMSSHLSDMISEQSHGNENEQDLICSICSGESNEDNELIQCTQCRQNYHCQCHEPPLRCPPRSTTWVCNNCRNGIQISTKRTKRSSYNQQAQRHNGTRRTVRKNYREVDEDDDDNESDYEREMLNQRRSKRVRRKSPQSIDDEQSDEEVYHRRPTRRRVQIAKSSSSSSQSSEISDEEEILADIHDDDDDDDDVVGDNESDIEQDDVDEEQEENGNADEPSLQ